MTIFWQLPGLPRRTLHMAIHGFVFLKYTKPADEHHLQVYPDRVASLLLQPKTQGPGATNL
jgi:hypothetical protein